MLDLSEEQKSVIGKIEKLLRLADKNPNPEEAAAAAAKAQDLMLAYNIEAALIDQSGSGDTGKRAEEKLRGGHHAYSRSLWHYVADLNFCLYWSTKKWTKDEKGKYRKDRWGETRKVHDILRWHHRIVGRKLNVEATKAQAVYLEQTIERLLRERIGNQSRLLFSNFAHSFRTGASEAICNKLYDRRQHLLSEEKRKAEEAARAATDRARAGHSTATAVSIASLRKSEEDANMDFLYGEGWSANQAMKRAERAAALKAAEEEHARWAAAHPEEAAKAERERRKEEERRERSRTRKSERRAYKEDKTDWGAYNSGYEAGEKVSIDPQVNSGSDARRIGRA